MPLTQEQEVELIRAIKSKAPNNIITAWLTETCGVSFQESFIIRRKIFEKLQDEKNTEQKESIEDSEEERTSQEEALRASRESVLIEVANEEFFPQGYRQKKKKPGRKSNKERMAEIVYKLANPPVYIKATECAECGDPTFQCNCPCQDQGLIAF